MIGVAEPTRQRWDAFVLAQSHTPLLQTWAWGEFQGQVGRPAVRILIEETIDGAEPKVVAVAQAMIHKYPGGFRSLYIPHGPVFANPTLANSNEICLALVTAFKKIAAEHRATFVRFEPTALTALTSLLPTHPVVSVQPAITHLLDLTKPEDVLLADFHQKTRYNIRLAEKHGVVVERGGQEFIDDFLKLSAETEAREGVHFFGANYFRALWQTPELVPYLSLYRARHEGQTLAAIIVIAIGDTAVYIHGGSGRDGREHMAPYLLQWTAIRDAQTANAHWYDFRGVAPADAPASHSWAGFSRFKRGFGGIDTSYPGAYDWARRSWVYGLYRLAQRLRH